ncbi:Unknown protein, partial [Striga hermonthica]
PRSRTSPSHPDRVVRHAETARTPPVVPHEETAESQSGQPRRSPPPARPQAHSHPARTNLRQQIERNRSAQQESTELEVLWRRIAELESRQRAQEDPPWRASTSAHVYLEADSLLTPELTSKPVPGKVKVPQIRLYDGTSDPDSHLGHYTSWMDLHGASDALRCRMFSLTLGPRAKKWYHSLPPHSIWKWQQLRSAFRSHFIGAQVCLDPKESLANVTQKDDESVKDYIARFNDRVQNMEPCHPETLLVMAIAGLKPNSIFRWTLCQNKPNTFHEFLARAQQHIIAEEAMSVPDFNFNPKSSKSGTDDRKKNKSFDKQNKAQFRGYPRGDANDPKIRAARKQYATDVKSGYQIRLNERAFCPIPNHFGCLRKNWIIYARQAYNSDKRVFTTDLRDVLNARNCPIIFNMEDANHFAHPHSDALVITVPIYGIPVHRVMVDTGAYSSILMLKAFDKMGLDPANIRPCNDQIQGFNGSISKPIGEITLPVRFGTPEHVTKLVMETFKVLDINNEYNAIIGRTALYKLRAAVSIFHYALKFPTTRGEGTHYRDQREARELITFIPSTGVHSTTLDNEENSSLSVTLDNTISEEPSHEVVVPDTSDPLSEER